MTIAQLVFTQWALLRPRLVSFKLGTFTAQDREIPQAKRVFDDGRAMWEFEDGSRLVRTFHDDGMDYRYELETP